MSRTLSVSRVTVPAELETEYLAVMKELVPLSEARGRRLWIFRSRREPRVFLECSESTTRETHRTQAERCQREQQLEKRLRQLGTYEPSAWELYEEVRIDVMVPSRTGQ